MTTAATQLMCEQDHSLWRIIDYFPVEIQDLLKDDQVNEIMCNPDGSWWTEGRTGISRVNGISSGHYLITDICKTIARIIGKDVNDQRPLLNGRLADGSRVAAVLEPVSQGGPTLTIRKFSKHRFTFDDFVRMGSIRQEGVEILKSLIGNKNLLFSGQPGAGKTTMLNTCLNHLDPSVRIGIIEDTAEIRTDLPHAIHWEAREPEPETPEVTVRQLVRHALRNRFDVLIVGETRDYSAYDLLQALNTGHLGSMSTIHANSPEDALIRLSDLAMTASENLSDIGMMRLASRLIHVVIQVCRRHGRRYVSEIAEVNEIDPVSRRYQTTTLYLDS